MPFSPRVKEDALVKSKRRCCICQKFLGLRAEVHHIVPEAEAGTNNLDNAIVLCFDCHADAGHYNLRHPRGKKYSPGELRRHRDAWWQYCEAPSKESRPKHVNPAAPATHNLEGFEVIEKEIGTLWSRYSNVPAQGEIVRFQGKPIAEIKVENNNVIVWHELYQLENDRYVVYTGRNHNGDWCTAHLAGVNAWEEADPPLALPELQDRYPALAKAAGLTHVREFRVDG